MVPTMDDGEETDEDDDEFAEHLSLRHTISRGADMEVKVDRPRAESIAVALEMFCVMGTLATFLPTLLLAESEGELWPAVVATIPWVSRHSFSAGFADIHARSRFDTVHEVARGVR
jgi:hypothetical protein